MTSTHASAAQSASKDSEPKEINAIGPGVGTAKALSIFVPSALTHLSLASAARAIGPKPFSLYFKAFGASSIGGTVLLNGGQILVGAATGDRTVVGDATAGYIGAGIGLGVAATVALTVGAPVSLGVMGLGVMVGGVGGQVLRDAVPKFKYITDDEIGKKIIIDHVPKSISEPGAAAYSYVGHKIGEVTKNVGHFIDNHTPAGVKDIERKIGQEFHHLFDFKPKQSSHENSITPSPTPAAKGPNHQTLANFLGAH